MTSLGSSVPGLCSRDAAVPCSSALKQHGAGRQAARSPGMNPLGHGVKTPGKGCGRRRKPPGGPELGGAHILKAGCLPQLNTSKACDPLRQSSQASGKGRTPKGNLFQFGGTSNLRRAVMTNWLEERRNKLYVEKLQRDLNMRLKAIEREKAATDRFLAKLHHTTGHFPDIKFWWE